MHLKAFLPRGAMPSCGVCLPVYLSVRPSVTFVNSVKMSNRILRIFSPSGSQTILIFPHQALWRYSDEDTLKGASNAGGVGKNRDSGRKLAIDR